LDTRTNKTFPAEAVFVVFPILTFNGPKTILFKSKTPMIAFDGSKPIELISTVFKSADAVLLATPMLVSDVLEINLFRVLNAVNNEENSI